MSGNGEGLRGVTSEDEDSVPNDARARRVSGSEQVRELSPCVRGRIVPDHEDSDAELLSFQTSPLWWLGIIVRSRMEQGVHVDRPKRRGSQWS